MMSEAHRFSDIALTQMRDQLKEHCEKTDQKFNEVLALTRENARSIEKLTETVETVKEDTSGVVTAHKNLKGAANVGKAVQNFMLWLTKWGVIGTAFYHAIKWLVDHFTS